VHRAGILDQPVGPEPDLIGRLLTAGVEDGSTGALQSGRRLEQEGGFSNSRLTADQRHGARNDPASEHEVELGNPGPPPGERFGSYFT
jgi:hypothetical protein